MIFPNSNMNCILLPKTMWNIWFHSRLNSKISVFNSSSSCKVSSAQVWTMDYTTRDITMYIHYMYPCMDTLQIPLHSTLLISSCVLTTQMSSVSWLVKPALWPGWGQCLVCWYLVADIWLISMTAGTTMKVFPGRPACAPLVGPVWPVELSSLSSLSSMWTVTQPSPLCNSPAQ